MNKLTPEENDLLQKIKVKPELAPFFFKRVNDLHWLMPLIESGFYRPELNPKPIPAKQEGYFNIPSWPALDFLVTISEALSLAENEKYAIEVVKIIRQVTNHAIENHYTNYRTWWKFSIIITSIPVKLLNDTDLMLLDYWISDQYAKELPAEQIGEKWVVKLLLSQDYDAIQFALKIIMLLFSISIEKTTTYEKKIAKLRIEPWQAKTIIELIAKLSGKIVGLPAVNIFESRLKNALDILENDTWSAIWRPAIEEHEQNNAGPESDDVLIMACRESLQGALESDFTKTSPHIIDLLSSKYITLKRIALFLVDQNNDKFTRSFSLIVSDEYFNDNFRHELWHFLKRHYSSFSADLREKTLTIIQSIGNASDQKQIAYERTIWLSAIKDKDENALKLYNSYIKLTNTEPDHPDFASYLTVSLGDDHSPIPIDDLMSFSMVQLHEKITQHHFLRQHFECSDGLGYALREIVKCKPIEISKALTLYIDFNYVYVYHIIEAYHALWTNKSPIVWDIIWPLLIEFSYHVLCNYKFWITPDDIPDDVYCAIRLRTVKSICRLIEDGVKSDEFAFSSELIPLSKKVLLAVFENQIGDQFLVEHDAVTFAINSPRGSCVMALVNLALRSCRLADKTHGNHADAWEEYRDLFEMGFDRSANDEFEFQTLIANYLPNFFYMSDDWTKDKLPLIFDMNCYLDWICAMQGYAYVKTTHSVIYKYLKDSGDFRRALNDSYLQDNIKKTIIQRIVISYLNGHEHLDDTTGLFYYVIRRAICTELKVVINFISALPPVVAPDKIDKIYELWPVLLGAIDFSKEEGQQVASLMSRMSRFINRIDDTTSKWLTRIAPFASLDFSAVQLLKTLARLSRDQPREVYSILMVLLESYTQDYPEKDIKFILSNLVTLGDEGKRYAENIVDIYLSHGTDRPYSWLSDMLK